MTTRVLHVITGVDVGGAETQLLSLVDGLVDRGFDVTVAYLKGDGELAEEFRTAGCDVKRIGIRADADPIGFLELLAHVARNDYDVVHGHLFHGNVYGVTAATLAGVPHVVSSKHNDPPFWDRQPYRTIHDATLSRVDRVFPISESVREYLLATTSLTGENVQTIRYGLDPTPFDAVDEHTVQTVRAEFVDDDRPLVGTVARLTEQKDLDTLLRAFATVHDTHDAHLAIVGRGEEQTRLESLAKELNLTAAVTFTGFREDVPALMHAFDVFALPSRWEGLGVVFLEAMAAGTPVVASNTSAIPEVVAHGETGILCPPGDQAAFADAIASVLADPERAVRMGQAGRERLEAEFAVERMVDETATAYRELLGESSTER